MLQTQWAVDAGGTRWAEDPTHLTTYHPTGFKSFLASGYRSRVYGKNNSSYPGCILAAGDSFGILFIVFFWVGVLTYLLEQDLQVLYCSYYV